MIKSGKGMNEMNANKKPVFEAKHRLIRASVFKNTTQEGKTYYNTQLVRRYKSGENEWSNSSHFTGEEDLIMLRDLVEKVLEYIRSQTEEDLA